MLCCCSLPFFSWNEHARRKGIKAKVARKIGWAAKIFWSKNYKNESCTKLPKMARNLVKNDFWTFQQMCTDVYKFASKCAQICACFYMSASLTVNQQFRLRGEAELAKLRFERSMAVHSRRRDLI